jgi:enediyne biosynthesis protein E4
VPVSVLALLAACSPSDPPGRDRGPDPATGDTGGGTAWEPGLPVEVALGEVVACADPAARDQRRFDAIELDDEPEKPVWHWAGGIVVADLDGDALHDLFLPGFWGARLYLFQPDGSFLDASDRLPSGLAGGSGGTAVDYDGDGDLDLLETRFIASNRLLRNDGGVFVDVSVEAGLSALPRRSMPSSWADLDRDGDLDLWIGNYGTFPQNTGYDQNHSDFAPAEPDFLYLNDGDGTFTDRSDLVPLDAHDGYTLAGGFHDLDRDSWPDLYIVNDFGNSYPNRLLWNREGTLVSDDDVHGLDVAITGMGIGVGDVNGDQVDDLVMSAWDGNSLRLSGAGGVWFEWANVLGPVNDLGRGQKIAWGTELADLDADGDLDIPMAYGWLDSEYPAEEEQPDAVYLQGEDGVFTDVAPGWGLDQPGMTRAMTTVDLDGDGFLDVVRRDLGGGPALVHLSRCGPEGWLGVQLRQPGQNRYAVGARVVVVDGPDRWDRVVLAGGTNSASGGPPEVLFGLGARDSVARIEVWWPDGEVSRVGPIDTRRVVVVERP